MKLTNLIWVLALAGVMAACNSGPPITNNVGTGGNGTGGTGGNGTGGTGGVLQGACTTTDNEAVYAELSFTNGAGVASEGTDAASAIASECLRGSVSSDPPITAEQACGEEVGDVITCFLVGCPQETIDALATCVEACTQNTIQSIVGSTIDEECTACYGDTVACGAAFCTNRCAVDANSEACIQCRCDNGCTPDFVVCSGIPSDDC